MKFQCFVYKLRDIRYNISAGVSIPYDALNEQMRRFDLLPFGPVEMDTQEEYYRCIRVH